MGAAEVLFSGVADLEIAYRHCKKFDVAVQAGGNCGIWPKALGEKFGAVYTFEPDPVNFRCLCANAPAENVFKFNAALGDKHRQIGLVARPDNCGAHYVAEIGNIPMLRIDDIDLDECDLIYLDVEGFELNALRGAATTISKCHPVIVAEDKGLSARYAVNRGAVAEWLKFEFGYRVAETVNKDVVLVR